MSESSTTTLSEPSAPRRIFITGTDTAVGKTILTSLLLAHLQEHAAKPEQVVALKPFCSGERTDAELLFEMQNRPCGPAVLSIDLVNPFYFAEPLAPWRAALLQKRTVRLEQALDSIARVSASLVLIEGAGGLLSPLGRTFSALDLITRLGAEVIVVAQDRLGVLNQVLLVLSVLRSHGVQKIKVALVSGAPDKSSRYNFEDLQALSSPIPVVRVPFVAQCRPDSNHLRAAARQMAASLKALL